MLIAAIALWLVFAFAFWCMMVGATRGDVQMEAALDRAKAERTGTRPLVDSAGDQERLSTAA